MGLAIFVVKAILILLAVWLALNFTARFFHRYYLIERKADVLHFAETWDGWRLALHRYQSEKPRNKKLPVILCHGLGGSRFGYDFSMHNSLARYLAEAGYDVWVLELRGVGESDKPRFLGERSYDWNFNDYLKYDLPAAIDYVLAHSGRKKLHWIGHSMGGMLMYAYLQLPGADKIATATAISSPGKLDNFKGIARFSGVVRLLPVVRLERLTQFLAPLYKYSRLVSLAAGIRIENMPAVQAPMVAANCQSNIPIGLLNQFGRWAQSGEITDRSGDYSYTANLDKITTPLYFMAGAGDLTAPPWTVEFIHEKIGSKDKRYTLFAANRGTTDYGHMDILVGRDAPKEVYPEVLQWLEDH